MKKKIALIFGGEGHERFISLMSARWVFEQLSDEKYEVIPVFISHRGDWYISKGPMESIPISGATPTFPIMLHGKSGLLVSGGILKIDVAIPILHGDLGEDGVIQGALTAAHIPFVGCDTLSSAVCADKGYTKAVAHSLGIKTAEWTVEYGRDGGAKERAREAAEKSFGYPMFIKPLRLGSSIGASAVSCRSGFDAAYLSASRYGGVLIERLIPHEYEIECAYLSTRTGELYSAGGVVKSHGMTYSFKEKYEGSAITAEKDVKNPYKNEVEALAKRLTSALGLSALARLDFFVGCDGEIYFNEINTLPGMTERSLYPSLTESMGLAKGEFLDILIDGVCP